VGESASVDLKTNGDPWNVSGVPPDYFSPTGQRWGNPLYRWDRMQASGYAWWIERFRACFALVDRVRVDHFRGFEAYWEIPANEETAINGRWRRGPGRGLFDAVRAALGPLPIIAEDLGTITPGVAALRDGLGFPGMKVMHFATGHDANNPHKEHNHGYNAVVYTGTHDNNTTIGWYRDLDEMGRHEVRTWLSTDGAHVALAMIDRAWASPARIAVAPMQDVLELGGGARMNTPGTVENNWIWRMRPDAFSPGRRSWLRQVTTRRDRLGRR
jgi:4-alpha-glucanotransferase